MEQLAPGRAVVAIGTGFTGRMAMGQKPLTWAYTRRYIEQVRALLRGEKVEVDGAIVQMLHGAEFAPRVPDHDADRRSRPTGRRAWRSRDELGDGVMTIGRGEPSFDWCAVLAFGTMLDDGESPSSARVFAAAGPAQTVVYHAMYEGNPESVDGLPGGIEWRKRSKSCPRTSATSRCTRITSCASPSATVRCSTATC